MSLQVWLPLNGSLENLGLSDLTFSTVDSSTISSSVGKVTPQCYYNDSGYSNSVQSASKGGIISNKKLHIGTNLSMFAWVNLSEFNGSSLASLTGIGGMHTISHINPLDYGKRTGMGITVHESGKISLSWGDGLGGLGYVHQLSNDAITKNKWYHIGFTCQTKNNVSTVVLYINGKASGIYNLNNVSNPDDYVQLFSWCRDGENSIPTVFYDYKPKGKINDFRIYDHTLSKKEVKELAKGLAFHYKLSGNGATNFLKGAGSFLESTPLVRQATDASPLYDSYVYYSQSILSFTAYEANTYTLVMQTDGNPVSHAPGSITSSTRGLGWFLRKGADHWSSRNCGIGNNGERYFTFTDIPAGTYDLRSNLYSSDGANYEVKMWNLKIIKGNYNPNDIWCPHDEDTLADLLKTNSKKEADCSGYGYVGNKNTTFEVVSNSAHYNTCYSFTGNNSIESFLDTNGWTDASISAWVKPSAFPTSEEDRGCILIGGFYLTITPYGQIATYCYGKTNSGYHVTSTTIPLNTWSHLVAVWNDTNQEHKIYINGKCVLTIGGCYGSMSSDWHKHKYIGKELWWAENHDNQWHRPFRGNISDARIYATALSEQDIAEMYKSIISVSKEGAMFGQDFTEKEKASINFGKNGKITASNFDVETPSPYEAKIKYLPDGTSWMRIHHLDVTKDKTYFTNASEVGKSVNKTNRYSRLNNIDNYKVGNNYEFMLTYPSMKTYTLGGYTPVDYIEFTGDQYIKTHINPIPQGDGVFTGHRWEIDAEFTPAPLIPKLTANTNEVRIWGTYKSDQAWRAYYAFDRNESTNADVNYGSGFSLNIKVGYVFPVEKNNISKIKLNAYVDGGGALYKGAIECTYDGTNWFRAIELNSNNFQNSKDLTFEINLDGIYGIRAGADSTNNGLGIIIRELQIYGISTRVLSGYGPWNGEYWGINNSGKYEMGGEISITKANRRRTFIHNCEAGNTGKVSLWINGEKLERNSSFIENEKYTIGGLWYLNGDGSVDYKAPMRVYRVKCFSGNQKILDMIPVKRATDGAGGLLDLVSNTFYGNSGSGSIIVGEKQKYTWLDYIESSGTQYIDTGFIPNQNTRITAVFSTPTVANNGVYIYGAGIDSSSRAFELYPWSNALQFNYGGDGRFVGTPIANQKIYTDQNKNVSSYTIGSTTYSATHAAQTFNAPYTLILFGLHRASIAKSPTGFKLYSCQIYDNGTLIRDYVPCLNEVGIAGLYDKVENKFYGNAEPKNSNGFIPGVKQDTQYQFLDYIESTGTQWIDTGIAYADTTKFDTEIALSYNEVSSTNQIMGFNGHMGMGIGTEGATYWECGGYTCFANEVYILRWIKSHKYCQRYISGVNYNTTTLEWDSWSGNLKLFAAELDYTNSTPSYLCNCKLYGCKIRVNDVLVREFIPCRRNDGTIGLYDIVNKQFYANSGSGAFKAGTPVNREIETYNRWIQTSPPSDGTVSGFMPIFTSWAEHNFGIRKHDTTYSLYDCDTGNTQHAPIGQYTNQSNDSLNILAADGSDQTETELWVRLDEFNKNNNPIAFYSGAISAKDFIEV